jgi:hypothetical protein
MDMAGGQNGAEQLRGSELIQGCGVLTMDKYIHSKEGSIEDLIGRSTYFGLVNLCYKLPRKKRLPITAQGETLSTDSQSKRLVQQVEEYFTSAETFNRYKPAEFLVEHTGKCLRKLPDLSGALDRFERLFADIKTCRIISQTPVASDYKQTRPIVGIEAGRKSAQIAAMEKG